MKGCERSCRAVHLLLGSFCKQQLIKLLKSSEASFRRLGASDPKLVIKTSCIQLGFFPANEEESADDIPNTDGSLSLSLASLPLPPEPQLFPEIDPSDFQVSLHGLYGHSSLNTLKLVGEIAGYQFSILVDSGSTHNLIQPRLARFLQLPIQPAPPFAVTVGNGETLHCLGQVTDLRMGLQGHNFLLDLYLLEVRGADIILGIQWLSQLGPVLADFADLTLTFLHEGSLITLAGQPKIKPTVASYQQVKRLAQSDGIEMAQLLTLSAADNASSQSSSIHPQIQALLQQYSAVFVTPKGFLPFALVTIIYIYY
ncbi:Aspartic peptidase [Corchorus olitorius]|uniref:Aspartic peptidase n=1 Tax=Corchorus olitorius TaxID=93759 RepID=A0A1R3IG64_9ROSI|nr:Aspartic peptidase [Corchorus olitorius]